MKIENRKIFKSFRSLVFISGFLYIEANFIVGEILDWSKIEKLGIVCGGLMYCWSIVKLLDWVFCAIF